MKSKKLLIIVIIIIAVLAVAGTVLGYLFMATDVFKSDKELFAKYISQNIQDFENVTNLQASEVYENLKNEDKYESNIKLNMTYSEGGEISNPINNLAVQIDMQKDNENQYFYADGQILYADEEYLELEVIQEQDIYGVRFSDVAKQFVSVKNDENFEAVANDIGIDSLQLENLMNIIDGTTQISEEIVSEEELVSIKDKYVNIVTEAISNGTFSSLKKAMITYNNNTIKTNSYAVSLSSEQVEEMLVQILNNLKTEKIILEKLENFATEEEIGEQIDEIIKTLTEETEVPTIRITVYEQDEKTLRTVVEIGLAKIIVENVEENGVLTTKIKLSNFIENDTTEFDISISKINENSDENFEITLETSGVEEQYSISFLNEMQTENEKIQIKSSIKYKQDIITTGLTMENTISIGSEFAQKQTLDNKTNVVLNDAAQERRVAIINALKENVPLKVETRLGLLAEALGLKNEEEELPSESEMSQVDINKFNAKFEFYTGDEVSAENVKTLLGIVANHLSTCEITPVENQEGVENTNSEDAKYDIKINIQKDQVNEDATNQVLEKIEDNKKYKVSIAYKELNGLIDYIMIQEVEK